MVMASTNSSGVKPAERDFTDSPWFIGGMIVVAVAALFSMCVPFFLDFSRYEPLGIGQHADHFKPGGLALPPEGDGEAYWHYMDHVSNYSYWARGESSDDSTSQIYAVAFQSLNDKSSVTYCVLTGPIPRSEVDNYIHELLSSLMENEIAQVEIAGKPSATCAFRLNWGDIGYRFPED
jgi:hypothetical protein